MKRLSLLVLLLISSTSPAVTQNALDVAFADTCKLSVYSCYGVERPKVIFMPLRNGLLGLYISGMNIVYLNDMLQYADPMLAKQVLVHEMTHYLQWVYDAPRDRCLWEAEAFAVSNLYVSKNGRPDLRRTKLRELYRCP